VIRIAAANVSVSLGDGTTSFVNLTAGSGQMVIRTAGIAGRISGTVTVSIPGVSFSGSLSLAMNNTTAEVHDSFDVGGSTVNLDLVAGPYVRVEGSNLSLTVLGQTLTGNISFEQLVSTGGERLVKIALSQVTLGLGDGTTDILSLTINNGALLVTNAGLAGQVSVAMAVHLTGFDVQGTAVLAVNTTGLLISETFEVGGETLTLDLPKGPYVRVEVNNAAVTILGQTLSGNLVFEQTTNTLGQKLVRLGMSEVTLTFGSVVSLTDGQGSLLLTPSGMAGSVSAGVALNVPGVTFSGNFALMINTTASAVKQTMDVNGTAVSMDLPAGPYVSVQGIGVTLNVLGQAVSGDFAFEQTQGRVVIVVNHAGLSLGNGDTDFVTVSDGTGLFLVTPSGLAGTLSADVAVNIPNVTVSGHFAVVLNNTGSAVTDSFTLGSDTIDLAVEAGPYLRVDVTSASLTVVGQTLSGNFTFEQSTTSTGRVVKVAATNVGLVISAGGSDIVTVSSGSALFVANASGMAGKVSASVTVTIPGLASASASNVTVSINNTASAVNTSLDVAGTPVNLVLPKGPYLKVQVLGMNLTVLSQTLTGDFVFEKTTTAAGTAVIRMAASHISLSLGDGTTTFVSVTEGQGALLAGSGGLAGTLSATVSVQNIPSVTFAGTFALSINTTGAAVNQNFTLDNTVITLALPKGPYLKVEGSNVVLGVAGQSISGSFAFEQITEGTEKKIRISAADVSLKLGGGAGDVVTVNNGSGYLVVTSHGMIGAVGATVGLNVPGVTFSGSFNVLIVQATGAMTEDITVNSETVTVTVGAGVSSYVKVEGNGVTLGILGQRLTGDFAFERMSSTSNGTVRNVIRLSAAHVSMGLGNGTTDYVVVENGSGSLIVTSAGLAGQIQADVSVQNITGVAFSGTLDRKSVV
jgi:hypothetical protein